MSKPGICGQGKDKSCETSDLIPLWLSQTFHLLVVFLSTLCDTCGTFGLDFFVGKGNLSQGTGVFLFLGVFVWVLRWSRLIAGSNNTSTHAHGTHKERHQGTEGGGYFLFLRNRGRDKTASHYYFLAAGLIKNHDKTATSFSGRNFFLEFSPSSQPNQEKKRVFWLLSFFSFFPVLPLFPPPAGSSGREEIGTKGAMNISALVFFSSRSLQAFGNSSAKENKGAWDRSPQPTHYQTGNNRGGGRGI